MINRRLAGVAIGAALLVSCTSDPTDGLQPSIAVFYGSIVTADGTPVSGAHVRVLIGLAEDHTCGPIDWLAGAASTDISGAYSVTGTFLHVSSAEMCVVLEVSPASGSGLLPRSVEAGRVRFIHQSRTPPVDSLYVEVELEPTQPTLTAGT
jgi:hypothetical protein